MPETTNPTNGERRTDKTYQKTVYLTEFGRARIQQWASENNLNFSAAVETLALMGLDDARADYAVPALRATTLQGLKLVFNRFAHLLSHIALDVTATRALCESIMLQTIRQVAAEHPTEFENIMPVPPNSTRMVDRRIRRMHDQIKQAVRKEAVQQLKKPQADLLELFEEEA